MIKKFFFGIVLILVSYSLAALGISSMAQFSENQIFGLQISGILATVNVVIAFLIIYLAKDKEQASFAKIFLGGMAVGAVLAGAYSERLRDPLRFYGLAEWLIGLLGVAFHLHTSSVFIIRPLMSGRVM